jgi:D-alanyl-D-alanine carboxypeptidase
LNNAGLPGKPAKVSAPQEDDIPEAVRDTPDVKPQFRLKPIWLIVGVLGLGAIALLLGLFFLMSKPKPTVSSKPTQPTPNPLATDNVLGHLPYKEAPASELQPITADRQIKLRTAAAQKFKEMSAAAGRQGVILVPISGFRSVADQQHLFFDVKTQRGQVASKRAEVSAPPGYSEHHTGYAMDLGDGKVPATNLSADFENTAAFKWLEKNAVFYSFEISFPKGNPQGVNYEPWHWRFVGDRDSLETFYKAKQLTRPGPTPSTTPSPTSASSPSTEASPTSASSPSTEASPTPTSTPSTAPSATP